METDRCSDAGGHWRSHTVTRQINSERLLPPDKPHRSLSNAPPSHMETDRCSEVGGHWRSHIVTRQINSERLLPPDQPHRSLSSTAPSHMKKIAVQRQAVTGGPTQSHSKSITSDYCLLTTPTDLSSIRTAVGQRHSGFINKNAPISQQYRFSTEHLQNYLRI